MNSVAKALAVIGSVGGLAATLQADDNSQGRKIDLPVPIGHEVKGLRVPVRNEEGKMEMQFDMETATPHRRPPERGEYRPHTGRASSISASVKLRSASV